MREKRRPSSLLSNIWSSVARGVSLLAVLFAYGPTQAWATSCQDLFSQQSSFENQLKPLRQKQTMIPVSTNERISYEVAQRGNGFIVSQYQTTIERGMYETIYQYPAHLVEVSRPFLRESKQLLTTQTFRSSEEAQEFIDSRIAPLEEVEDSIDLRRKMAKRVNRYELNLTGREKLSQKIFESLSFVLKEYQGRKGWPPEFLERLLTVAIQYAYYSTYVNVRALNADGSPGELIGTIRNIQVPYARVRDPDRFQSLYDSEMVQAESDMNQLLRNEIGPLYSKLRLDFQNADSKDDSRRFGLDPVLGKALFQKMALVIENDSLRLRPHLEGGLAYIPTPMELVLKKYYPEHRTEADGSVRYFNEPGNFAVTPDRALPEHLRKIAGPTLYFHAARILREEAGAQGPTTKIGTYASDGGASDRFYRYLGLKLEETLAGEDRAKNPTQDAWNVLLGEGDALETALKTRMGIAGLEDRLDQAFEIFDHADRNFLGALPR